ncbi:Class I glutamine amidotransferase-like protein [Pleurostoma richardsiae]|uniref:Class I glutamine amidotransferase-like protein n=1 Tax=Pleurostoma richardsiae TaxID=41990 RepID=A0AA38RA28_9PEZI|nr:Class I glutamine amidotransferase-like protein [Pleurostoma richardsiae]
MEQQQEQQQVLRVLAFSKTSGYRHESIPAGVAGLRRLAATSSSSDSPFTVDATEDAAVFTPPSLARYAAIVLLQTSGDFLDGDQLGALKAFVHGGGGIVAIHCASTGMPSSEWYGRLIGAVFTEHPEPQPGLVVAEDPEHIILSNGTGLKALRGPDARGGGTDAGLSQWAWYDEWYNFKENPRVANGVHVLLRVSESSYRGGTLGEDHPVAWCQEFEGSRSFHTALGHFDEAWGDDTFTGQILNAIWWVARVL